MNADKSNKEEREFLLQFIELYRSLTSLWDVKSSEYTDRQKREENNDILLKKFQERYPEATKKDVSRKINVLRSNFKRELRRLNELDKSGAGVNDESNSRLWYFDALRFIKDVETPSSSRSNVLEIDEPPTKIKKNISGIEELDLLSSHSFKEKRSAFKAASEVWARKLENMDKHQAVLAEMIINEVIYEAQLGKLNENSVRTLGKRASTPSSPFYHNLPSSSEMNISQSTEFCSNARNFQYKQPPIPFATQPTVASAKTLESDEVSFSFGKTIALQLRKLTLREATMTMSDIHRYITRKVLANINASKKINEPDPFEEEMDDGNI